ncbi:hypothetical protein [Streptomyces sp. JB150]|uniref:hypothetical protein n=1 Tax=Streptomyces sp. JB150 TaxID=2714844 RepID=UPI00140E1E00|nr:hypothetical protein [Streptomyces sp. JB150]QIJ60587.1 hypothetical protein G7Z13_14670 [Streptomyces sp. JB150]
MTAQERPIDLGPPLDPPAARPDCAVCQALARQRAEAAARGDHSRVTDCDVEIRNHHAPVRRPASG